MAAAARRLEIEVLQPDSVNHEPARAAIAAAGPEVVCVCAYGGLIREPLLSDHEIVNVHPSLLPRWRGAAPIERAIMAGDEQTGVSIMRVTAGLDSGPVLLAATEAIREQDTYGTLAGRLAEIGGRLLVRALDEHPDPEPQPEDGVTYAEKITPEDRRLDPARTARELELVVRGLAPHIGAWAELPGGTRLGVAQAQARAQADGRPGDLERRDGVPVLVCAEGELALLRVKPPGGREMGGPEWLRGHLR